MNRRTHNRSSVEALAARLRTWGRWGQEDQLGSANYVSPEKIAAGARLIRRGAVFQLSLPLDRSGPMTGRRGRVNPQHLMLQLPVDPLLDDGGLLRIADDALYMPLQSSTQWDALAHVFYDGQSYNGRGYETVTTNNGAAFNDVTGLTERAVGRGVLLDVARFFDTDPMLPGQAIQAEDLENCAAHQGVEVQEGDFLLIRTGHLGHRRASGEWGDFAGGSAPGLGVSAAEFIGDHRVAAVATDTWGIEAIPYETPDMSSPLHVVLLVNAGVWLGEMWDLDKLAEDCRDDSVYEFFLSACPLNIVGAVGSPTAPIAIK